MVTHCTNGHEYTPANTIRTGPDGRWRVCRTCKTARESVRYRCDRCGVGTVRPAVRTGRVVVCRDCDAADPVWLDLVTGRASI